MEAGRGRSLLLGLMTMLITLGAIEAISYVGGRYLERVGVFYRPRFLTDYPAYLAARDAALGWPAADSFGRGDIDAGGARVSPAFPDPTEQPACVALYGDSFTWSNEVGNEEAWGNVLAHLAGCPVANYGVGGYGTDQAYLRFKSHAGRLAPVVVLCHLTENIMRNVNQYRDLLYAGQVCGFKPRFILDDEGRLVLVPIPSIPPDQYHDFGEHPERVLRCDYFVPGGSAGLRRLSFPYTWSLLRAFGHFHIRARLAGRPWYSEFYEEDHPAEALEVTAAILEAFTRDALAAGCRPLVVILPTGLDLTHYRRHGTWVHEGLIARLCQAGVEPFDLSEPIMSSLGGRDPCELFTSCSAHYNAEGYHLIAELLHGELQRRGYLPPGGSP